MSDDSKLISEWQEENNETRIYYAFDRRMVTAHRESKDEEAEKLARFLLDKAEIPLLIRYVEYGSSPALQSLLDCVGIHLMVYTLLCVVPCPSCPPVPRMLQVFFVASLRSIPQVHSLAILHCSCTN